MTDTRTRFEALCREQSACGDDFTITDETRLGSDLQLDSLDLIDLSMRCEEMFGVEIPDEDVDDPATGTFGGMLARIESKLGG